MMDGPALKGSGLPSQGEEDSEARVGSRPPADESPEEVLRGSGGGGADSTEVEVLPPAQAERSFRQVLALIPDIGKRIDEVLGSAPNLEISDIAARMSTAGVSSRLLREGLTWCLEEFQKERDASDLKTNADRFRAIELARRTYSDFLSVVKQDQRERDRVSDREALMMSIASRIDSYIDVAKKIPSSPMRRTLRNAAKKVRCPSHKEPRKSRKR